MERLVTGKRNGRIGTLYYHVCSKHQLVFLFFYDFQVVHQWVPNHRDLSKRSHVDKTILLIKIDERYVPIAEAGVLDLGAEV